MQNRTNVAALLFVTGALVTPAGGSDSAPSLAVSPSEITLRGSRDRIQLVLTATIADARHDATREATWQSTNEAVVKVDASGVAQAIGDGAAAIVVRYRSDALTVPVTVSGCQSPRPVSFRQEVNPVLTKAGCRSCVRGSTSLPRMAASGRPAASAISHAPPCGCWAPAELSACHWHNQPRLLAENKAATSLSRSAIDRVETTCDDMPTDQSLLTQARDRILDSGHLR